MIDELYDLEVIERADRPTCTATAVAVDADQAADDGLAVGDAVPFRFADGRRRAA